MMLMIGIGILTGAAAFWLLSKATSAITAGNAIKAALPLLGNLLLIGGALVITALVAADRLVYIGGGLAGGLILSALVRMIVWIAKNSRRKGDGKK